jgi:hypothetical protein
MSLSLLFYFGIALHILFLSVRSVYVPSVSVLVQSQGDQMSLGEKNHQKCSPTNFCQNDYITFSELAQVFVMLLQFTVTCSKKTIVQ